MRTVRRVSRTILFGGMLLMVILFLMGEFIKVDGLAFAALACGFASAISYFVLFFVGGLIHPTAFAVADEGRATTVERLS